MAQYLYADDGKIHTRYTELMRCTPGQIERVVAERRGLIEPFRNESLEFGADRHEMLEAEARSTGRVPAITGLDLPADIVEEEVVSEIMPNVVLHSRLDVISRDAMAIIDYKTLIADSYELGVMLAVSRYKSTKQLPLYAYQVGLNGIRIKRLIYVVEIWNRQMDTILGYKVIEKQFRLSDAGSILPWVSNRVAMLAAALDDGIEE